MSFIESPARSFLTLKPISALAELILPCRITVFMLHRVMPAESGVAGTTPAHLRNCLNFLRQHNYNVASIEDVLELALRGHKLPKKTVAFTLDDGFYDQVTAAAEIFKEFDYPSTCFLITGMVDGDIWPWDYQLMHVAKHAQPKEVTIAIDGSPYSLKLGEPDTKNMLLKFVRRFAADSAYKITRQIADAAGVQLPETPPPDMQPATWDAVRAAEKLGMRFGAHSTNHFILSRVNDETLRAEMQTSLQRIQQECKNPSSVFCYPSGKVDEFDQRAMQFARELGLRGALSAEPGFLEPSTLRSFDAYQYAIPRLPLPTSLREFEFYLSWAQYLREHFSDSALAKHYRR